MQFVFFGIITGSLLVVATSGFALIRNTQGFLNIAHGQYILLGAVLGLTFLKIGLNMYIAAICAAIVVGVVGTIFAWLVFFPLRDKGLLTQFFSSVGISFIVYGLIQATWSGSGIKVYPLQFSPPLTSEILSLSVTIEELIVVSVAWLSMAALHIFLNYTTMGVLVRAEATNLSLAQIRGVPTSRVFSTVWFVGSALAGLSGVLIGLLGSVHGELGWQYILIILAVSVMGGVKSIYGVVAASFIVGMVTELSSLIIPSGYTIIVVFGVIILTLMVKPEGLFAIERRYEAGS